MVGKEEANELSTKLQSPQQEKLKLYTDIVYRESVSALAKYLPEALPQEPTEIFIGVIPQYLGKLQNKHCIALEQDPHQNPLVQMLEDHLQEIKWLSQQQDLIAQLDRERFRLQAERAKEGNYDFTDIDERIDQEQARIEQMPKPEAIPTEPKDWDNPEKLLHGSDQYSIDTWRHIHSLIHELIHQKQAELNPQAFLTLASPELEDIDLNTADRSKLYNLLSESHKAQNREGYKESLFDPVIEGMAVLGTFYVMGKLAEELKIKGEDEAANNALTIRNTLIFEEIVESKRKERAGKPDYDQNYAEGIKIMKNLYQKYGLENILGILSKIDLKACQQITKDSPRYREITEDPSQLPGLPQAA